jgi:Xaa-Pro aminopeptidase
MLNSPRRQQLLEEIRQSGWDLLLLYGHSWRKDFFRSLVNFNFFGPHAVAALSSSGGLSILVAHPWDQDSIVKLGSIPVRCSADFSHGLQSLLSESAGPRIAVAGLELMEARFADVVRKHSLAEPVSATALVETRRRFKTAEEIEFVKAAARLADLGYQHFVHTIEAGMAEYELVAEVEAFLKSRGAEDNFMLIASGGTEVYGMRPPTERRFQKGDNVITELSPQVNGYYAQICRTLVLGQPSPNQERSFTIFQEAQQAAETFLRPGVNIRDVARVQNDVFRREGYGEYTGAKYTRVRGHNLGLHVDENPYILEDVDCLVDRGMVLIPHPNTYLPLSGYMVFGDTLLVTPDGCVSLNQTDKKLFCKAA